MDSVSWQNIYSESDFRAMGSTRSLVSIALQSQYSHSEKIRNIGALFQEELDASPSLDAFFRCVTDPNTANGIFLDWWGRRVGVNRFLKVEGEYKRLDDDFFRFLIFYRAMANISGCTALAINRLLTKLTGFPCFVVDYQDMAVNIIVVGEPSSLQTAILANYGLLNRPAGVLANVLIMYPDMRILGFYGSRLQPFNLGVINPSIQVELSNGNY